jgi:hypothetical protein
VTVLLDEQAPVLSAVSPASVAAKGLHGGLTVTGSGFSEGSVVLVNGSPRRTVFVSSTELEATILGKDIAVPGTLAITVHDGLLRTPSNILGLSVVAPGAGPAGPRGPTGPTGARGAAGTAASVPSGTIILLPAGTPAPAGFTKVGATTILLQRTAPPYGAALTTFDIYRKI